MTCYWDGRGREYTERTVKAAVNRAHQLGIQHLVVASNTGYTALKCLNEGLEVVVVTHHVGFRNPGEDEMPPEVRQQLLQAGARLLTTTHLFANVERAVTSQWGGLYPGGIISHTLRMFGQGTKVCLEIATMALDAGLIPYGREIVAIGGSGRGADTALVLLPEHAKNFFAGQVLEIICKPRFPRG